MILKNDSIADVRDAIRGWVDLLSKGKFEEAANEINSQDSSCVGEFLVEAIGRYSREYRDAPVNARAGLVPKVTSPNEMIHQGENMVMYVKEDSIMIEYDLPIENAWSDLTAKFKLTERNEGGSVLLLVDILVL